MHFIFVVMHALYIAICNIGSDLADWPAFQSQPGLCSPHLGPSAGVWLSPAIATPCDWWQLFTDEAVFIIPVQGCTDQMDPDHPSTVRDTSVPVVAQSTNKSPAPWKAAVSRRGMDAAAFCLLKTRERSLTHKTTKSLFHSCVFAQYDDLCVGVYCPSLMKFCITSWCRVSVDFCLNVQLSDWSYFLYHILLTSTETSIAPLQMY